MSFLLDTNTLIQAKNEYYSFDLCPGFWDWLEVKSAQGVVCSIEPVFHELLAGDDELSEWAREKGASFFKPIDSETLKKMPEVTEWVQNHDFKIEAKQHFLSKADPLLIAFCLAHPEYTLTTHEVLNITEKKTVKIPNVCNALGVDHLRTFDMLRSENARFIMP